MAVSYRGQVATMFEVLAEGLAPFVDARMEKVYPGEDWVLIAANKLGKRRDVLVSLSDPHFQLEVINRWWGPAFERVLGDRHRQTVTDLRTARNYWAHPDEAHPFDFDFSLEVFLDAEDILRAIQAPQADDIVRLTEDLRWDNVSDVARDSGQTETEALMEQFSVLQKQYDELQGQFEEVKDEAKSATGKQRAATRQLAELQSQYAAVTGLRDAYLSMQRLAESDRLRRDDASATTDLDPDAVHEHLRTTESTIVALQERSEGLRVELTDARASLANVNPVETDEGRRWIWLIIGLLMVMALLVIIAANSGSG
jgi:prefoldin subunit 5